MVGCDGIENNCDGSIANMWRFNGLIYDLPHYLLASKKRSFDK